ncbi:MAG TPA: hypothetical protein VFZ31_15960 [Vicinamibacterales bacterium]
MRLLLLALLLSARPVDPIAAETLEFALERSPLVRSLIGTLDRSNVIVHIQSSRQLPPGISGTTRFVVTRGGYRYLRIAVATDLPKAARAAILGHELQHAVEVARSDAADGDSLRRLFSKQGEQSGRYFDTRAAVRVERNVRRELLLQAEPVIKFDH